MLKHDFSTTIFGVVDIQELLRCDVMRVWERRSERKDEKSHKHRWERVMSLTWPSLLEWPTHVPNYAVSLVDIVLILVFTIIDMYFSRDYNYFNSLQSDTNVIPLEPLTSSWPGAILRDWMHLQVLTVIQRYLETLGTCSESMSLGMFIVPYKIDKTSVSSRFKSVEKSSVVTAVHNKKTC